ncbi:MAG: hypothetical protein QM769_11035 [Pseudoxanthomonas sp.]
MRLLLLAFALVMPCAYAQRTDTVPIGVQINGSATDAVGQQFIYEIREKVRRSQGMFLADTYKEATLSLQIVTLDPDENVPYRRGEKTIYSVVITTKSPDSGLYSYLNNVVGICGITAVESCAQRAIAIVDESAMALRMAAKILLEQQGVR